ncbi:MAG: GNAT family N-acetyltransferase [Firmicutes bacterium]|nr:GNAT family N-acetyltransferase [Bacillota bacterium]
MRTEDFVLTVKGGELLLRNPRREDAEMMLAYFKKVCGETLYLVKEPEEITLTIEEEEGFIQRQNDSENSVMLLGFLNGKYVGNCSLMGNGPRRYRHRVGVGIALLQEFTGLGIGRAMIDTLLKIAGEKGFEQAELEVVADNKRALRLYKDMGFEIYGTLPDNMKYQDGTYADAYWMMKKL